MPFDGLTRSATLDDIVASLGIEPISMQVLNAHKNAEIKKHPGSFFWRHHWLYIATVIAVGFASAQMMFAALISLPATPLTILMNFSLVAISFAALAKLTFFHRFVMPATWSEEQVGAFTVIPKPIRDLGLEIKDRDPSIQLVIGTLKQEIVLDPYLLAVKFRNGEKTAVCLGIWDGDKIIQIASRH